MLATGMISGWKAPQRCRRDRSYVHGGFHVHSLWNCTELRGHCSKRHGNYRNYHPKSSLSPSPRIASDQA